jgi:hypothetical protein
LISDRQNNGQSRNAISQRTSKFSYSRQLFDDYASMTWSSLRPRRQPQQVAKATDI